MIGDIVFLIQLAVSFLPFVFFAFLNSKANVKKENRHRQYPMPVFSVVYSVVLLIFLSKIESWMIPQILLGTGLLDNFGIPFIGGFIRNLYEGASTYFVLVVSNTLILLLYINVKRAATLVLGKLEVKRNSFVAPFVELFYSFDEDEGRWFIREHFGQACTFIKWAYYGGCFVSGLTLFISCVLCLLGLISAPFYPVFSVIVIGEMAFFIDGIEGKEKKSELSMQADNSKHFAMYPLLRKSLKSLFGDKLSAEGTSVNDFSLNGGAAEDVLSNLDKNGGHIGENYVAFIRRKIKCGLKPNVDYLRSGYDLSVGKSLLFNTPFYDKLNPYVFYAMNRSLLTGGKVLVVLGRHGTEEDFKNWCIKGTKEVTNVPDMWKISVLSGEKPKDDILPDIGIIAPSGVHNLDIHKQNLEFLRQVSFVVLVEPSRLVTTAQIGLKLLIKCCGEDEKVTFCSFDRNCDGLVDALSHILMTNITEVSSTEYPPGISSYMCWTADDDYIQHRILPGVSRYLGTGTELSMVALKNQVEKTVWYGGDTYPVKDAHWIAKQYYHDLLEYANLPTNQETFDKCFETSFNMCNERVRDYSFITVEDDRNNLFETRRNFATIARQQGFVNVVSSEYMLREYMADNAEVFTADPKAIPYITADYARTKRNSILSLALLLCIDSVQKEVLERQMVMMNIDTKDPVSAIWDELCVIFGAEEPDNSDREESPVLVTKNKDGKTVKFKKTETIIFKREYSVDSGKFENVYKIEDERFAGLILDDLQNASYIAEHEDKDVYIGTELKGHVYQKYLPGQFFTLNGKYYEMISTAADNRILVRRAADHITGRKSYRQMRNYKISRLENQDSMGAMKTVNNIDIHYQYADFSVETPGYWKLGAYNDFINGKLVKVNGVPEREYHHKQILKFDFSGWGDAFTDSIRITLTNLLNEVFVTLFAENQPFISAITPGSYNAPLTYSLELGEGVGASDKCIFIIEDSQLDIGLLVAVERNVSRIFEIISDYLEWNDEKIEESIYAEEHPEEEKEPEKFDVYEGKEEDKKKNIFARFFAWIKGLFKKKEKPAAEEAEVPEEEIPETEEAVPETESGEPTAEQEEMISEAEEAAEPEEIPEETEDSAEEETALAFIEEPDSEEEIPLLGEPESEENSEEPEIVPEETKTEAEVSGNE